MIVRPLSAAGIIPKPLPPETGDNFWCIAGLAAQAGYTTYEMQLLWVYRSID